MIMRPKWQLDHYNFMGQSPSLGIRVQDYGEIKAISCISLSEKTLEYLQIRIDGKGKSGLNFVQGSENYLKVLFCDYTKSISELTNEESLGQLRLGMKSHQHPISVKLVLTLLILSWRMECLGGLVLVLR